SGCAETAPSGVPRCKNANDWLYEYEHGPARTGVALLGAARESLRCQSTTTEREAGDRFPFPVSRSILGAVWAIQDSDLLTGGGMGQGIQQPPVQQSGGSSLLDVLKVLYEPSAVFERVREKPSFLVPYLVICVVQIAVYFVNMPFLRAGMAAQMASRPAGGPDPSKFLWIGAVFIPVGFAIGLLIGAGLLWVLVSV